MEVGASSFICRIDKRAKEQTMVKFMSLNIFAPFLIFPYPQAIAEALNFLIKKSFSASWREFKRNGKEEFNLK